MYKNKILTFVFVAFKTIFGDAGKTTYLLRHLVVFMHLYRNKYIFYRIWVLGFQFWNFNAEFIKLLAKDVYHWSKGDGLQIIDSIL